MAKQYKVLNLDGNLIDVRKSNSNRVYSHAVIWNGHYAVSYCGRYDLASKRRDQLNNGAGRPGDYEIVPVIEIDSAEYRQCKKELAA